ncbi:3-dehydroshikimate dehydratase-like protein 3 [Elsinoe fawcettii]|nr:3-dehydroshikimate dehydratase-like protein 3 [Elsinoe fawcettii]
MAGSHTKLALSTTCLGLHPNHHLEDKLEAAARYGFKGIEIVYADLENYSRRHGISLQKAADKIAYLCKHHDLHVLSLCPFENFEGSSSPLNQRLQEAKRWLEIANGLGAAHMQVPAQYRPDAIGDESTIVAELQALSDLASSMDPPIKIAYEPMSWSIYHSLWQEALRLCDAVDRSNFGLCVDTFHIASRIWGDPYAQDGMQKDGPRRLEYSLRRFVADVPMEKLFYIQLSDGEKLDPPFSETHPWYAEGEAAEFSWSKHGRPFPLETQFGGYFPVKEMLKAWLIDMNYQGWISFETFDERMREEGFKLREGARRAEQSWQLLWKEVEIQNSRS